MSLYDRWLDEANAWPSGNDAWSIKEVDQFLMAFELIVGTKRAQHGETLEALNAAIQSVSRDCMQSLTYVGWRLQVLSEQVVSVPVERAPLWDTKLLLLADELRAVEQYLSAPRGEGFDSHQRWFAGLQPHVDVARELLREMGPPFQEIVGVAEMPPPALPSPHLDSVPSSAQAATGASNGAEPATTLNERDAGQTCSTEPEQEINLTQDSAAFADPGENAAQSVHPSGADNLASGSVPLVEAPFAKSVVADTSGPEAALNAPPTEPSPASKRETLIDSRPTDPAATAVGPVTVSEPALSIGDERKWVDSFLDRLRTSAEEEGRADSDASSEIDSATGAIDIEGFHCLFWNRIGLDDIAGAYWFARVIDASGDEPPMTPKTLAAMHALRLYREEPEELLNQCSPILDYRAPSSDAERLAVLGSSLRMALVAPQLAQARNTSFELMLRDEPPIDELKPIFQAVREYSILYQPLHRRYASAIASEHQKEAATKEAALALKVWLAAAQSRTMRLPSATEVFRSWVEAGGRLQKAALPILKGRVDAVKQVSQDAEWWANAQHVESALNTDHRRHRGKGAVQEIIADSRAAVVRASKEFSTLLKNWCEAVGYAGDGEETAPPQVKILRDRLRAAAPQLSSWMLRLTPNGIAADAAAMRHLHRELTAIYDTLMLELASPAHASGMKDTWYREAKGSLDLALRRRLDLVPGLEIGDEVDIEERLPTIGLALAASTSEADPPATVKQWLNRGDFRWIDRFLEALATTPVARELGETAARHRAESSRLLGEEVNAAAKEVQQAAIGTWLPNTEAERLHDELQSIAPGEVLLFPPQMARVREIRGRCRGALVTRLTELAERWYALHSVLIGIGVDSKLSNRLTVLLHGTLEALDVRAATTLLNEIGLIADRSEGIGEALASLLDFSPEKGTSVFDTFLKWEPAIGEWLSENDDVWLTVPEDPRYLPERILHGKSIADIRLFAPASDVQRREAAQATMEWMQLRSKSFDRPGIAADAIKSVERILSFLGFVYQKEKEPIAGRGHLFLNVTMSAGTHAPVPLWGSQSHDLYHILVVTNKPSVRQIQDRIAALPRHKEPLLLLYLEHLEPETRRSLAAFTRTEQEPILVLDDVLMLFLAQSSAEHRLRSFFECSLPFSATNPYVAQRDGPVAPEMFRGHKDAINELMKRDGTCFICGGRQFGKSALQNYIQKQFDQQTPNRHVWYINIKEMFNPRERQSAKSLWNLLLERFSKAGLLAGGAVRRSDIAGRLKQVFDRQPALEVTVFLDEADDLLEAMIRDRRQVWTAATTLMNDTQRRLKIVFAGNYHISRFAMQRNQSATIMGVPIEIGPMEFAAATDLIVRPLQALGYRFTNSWSVLNILSLTYRHASLLQLFMHALLQAKMEGEKASGPPWDITPADIERTYRNEDVRKQMRSRIDLTLQLDPEYCALAYAMLLDQESSGDFRVAYETTELRQKASALWPQGFEGLSNADVEARLNEMRAVGIVRRHGERFRLAGPHMVSLFGDYANIRAGAEDLAGKEPRPKFDESVVHAWLGRTAGRYSPLTLVQEHLLQLRQTQTRLLFLSPAGGLDQMEEVFETLQDPSAAGQATEFLIPGDVSSRETIIWLRAFRRKQEKQALGSHAILLQHLRTTSSTELLRHVSEVQTHCRSVYNPTYTFQVAFVLDPASGWAWLQNDAAERRGIEDSAIDTVHWDALGIRSRLEDLGKMFTPRAAENVRGATSGWHLLLSALFEHWPVKTDDDPTGACEALSAELADNSETARNFAAALGLEHDKAPERALLGLVAYGEPITFDEALDLLDRDAGPAIEFLRRYGLVITDSRDRRMLAEPLAARVWSQSTVGLGVT